MTALLWGGLAAASLILGAVLATLRSWSDGFVGAVLAFGAGALIASLSFELAEEGVSIGGALPVALGLAAGALAFFGGDRLIEARGGRERTNGAGLALAVGALLDGIPEQAVLGIGLSQGQGVSLALLVAIFVSNLPESIGSSSDMLRGGESRRSVLRLWLGVSVVCALATGAGALLADLASESLRAGIDGFAAGALLTMLIDSMAPEAREKARDYAGLCTVVGFAVAAGLSLV
jgi:ZIP family zinc transporter